MERTCAFGECSAQCQEIFVWGEGGNEYLVEGEEMRNIFVWEKYWELLL